jgi:hypothetical protein
MPMEAAGAAALRMNSAKIKIVVNFFISGSFFPFVIFTVFPLLQLINQSICFLDCSYD